jgi:HAD superfamily hydrolase (TIGR01509 family)
MNDIREEILTQIKGAIFDIDGTMIDSMKIHLEVWHEIAERYGARLSMKEVGEKAYGINPEILERIFPGKLSDEEKERIANEKEELFRSRFDPEQHVIKGFLHFLSILQQHNIPMVIGSAAPEENIQYFMDRLGIAHYFRGAIHEDIVVAGKPNPDVFIKAAELINVPAAECVVFEDSPSGAEAAQLAGCRIIAVLTTKGKSDFKEIDGIIAYIKDYTDIMD